MRTTRTTTARPRCLRRLAAAAAAVALLGTGCGSDDDAGPATSPPGATQPPAGDAADDPSAGDDTAEPTITIEGFSFGPDLEVEAGTTVRVVNTDSDPHTWTAIDGTFDSGSLGQGDEFTHTFDEPGEYEFSCAFHPTMTGTITVTS